LAGLAPRLGWSLGAAVRDLPTVHDLGEDAQLHAHASDSRRLLRGEATAQVLGDPLGIDFRASGYGVRQLTSHALVLDARLARRGRLSAGLGDACEHLVQHLDNLGGVGAAVDGGAERVRAGDGGLLRHGSFPSVLGR